MLDRMDGNLARFENKLDEHFSHGGCPHSNDLRNFYGDSLQHARDMVRRYKRHMLDRPWTNLCCDGALKHEMYETVDDFIVLVNLHFANCPGRADIHRARTPLSDIIEE
uniref:Uncharacterized protein n=1 Tax=Panagrolaimus sp. ES5 TaxID=591445 RepID=A0AC34G1H5_9BILA